MSPALARRQGPRLLAALRAFALLVTACGSRVEADVEAGTLASDGFEGPNFYESDAEPAATPAPVAQPPVVPSNAAGVVGFVSNEEQLSACVGTVAERTNGASADPSLLCPRVLQPMISDFSVMPGGSTETTFFDYRSSVPGGTYYYQNGPGTLRSDVSQGEWHLSGRVEGISGFGLYLAGCNLLDASSYGGVQFNLRGSIGAGGSLVFFVGTAENQVSHLWINDNKPNASDPDEPPNPGRCVPLQNRYDGTCREARVAVPVSESVTRVQIAWNDLDAGCPSPSVNPREITSIAWYFPAGPAGAYTVDLHIDDLRFLDAAPL